MNTTKGLVVVIVLFLAAAFVGGYLWRGTGDDNEALQSPSPTLSGLPLVSATPKSSVTATKAPAPKTYTIRLTTIGIQPNALTIHPGDSVTFQNDTDLAFWPASNPHPTHTDCPGFDALRSLKRGESYSLVFPAARTCGFHNHLAPTDNTMRGTIVIQ